jgi:Flp pilus assembly protein CpaB
MTGVILSGATVVLFVIAGTLFGAGAGRIAAALQSLKGGKAVPLILGAMFTGFVVGGFGGVFNYIEIHARETKARVGWNLKPVVVAAADIRAGDLVTFDVISQRAMPEQFVTSIMVTPDRAERIVNKKARYAVRAGDVVLDGLTCP